MPSSPQPHAAKRPKSGLRECRASTCTIAVTCEYDLLFRLTSAAYSGGAEYEYCYDAVRNRQTVHFPEGQASYTYDGANRLTSAGGVTYTWDDGGNLAPVARATIDSDAGQGLRSVAFLSSHVRKKAPGAA